MRFFRIVVTLFMLAVWPAAAMHCKLETLPLLAFLSCEVEADGAKDCRDDGCESIEDVLYKAPESQNVVPAPVLATELLLFRTFDPNVEPSSKPILLSQTPPEIVGRWQFLSRAAGSPRAPSFVA